HAASDDRPADVEDAGPPPGQQRRADHQHRHRQEDLGDLAAVVTADLFEEQGGEEEDRERREIGAESYDDGRPEAGNVQEAKVEQWPRSAALAPDEGRGGHGAGAEQPEHLGRGEARTLRGDDREDQRGERGGAEQRSGYVDRPRVGIGVLRQDDGREDDRGGAEGHVEEEDRAPGPGVDQGAADDGTEREREPGHAGPDADRPVPRAGTGITVRRTA